MTPSKKEGRYSHFGFGVFRLEPVSTGWRPVSFRRFSLATFLNSRQNCLWNFFVRSFWPSFCHLVCMFFPGWPNCIWDRKARAMLWYHIESYFPPPCHLAWSKGFRRSKRNPGLRVRTSTWKPQTCTRWVVHKQRDRLGTS